MTVFNNKYTYIVIILFIAIYFFLQTSHVDELKSIYSNFPDDINAHDDFRFSNQNKISKTLLSLTKNEAIEFVSFLASNHFPNPKNSSFFNDQPTKKYYFCKKCLFIDILSTSGFTWNKCSLKYNLNEVISRSLVKLIMEKKGKLNCPTEISSIFRFLHSRLSLKVVLTFHCGEFEIFKTAPSIVKDRLLKNELRFFLPIFRVLCESNKSVSENFYKDKIISHKANYDFKFPTEFDTVKKLNVEKNT